MPKGIGYGKAKGPKRMKSARTAPARSNKGGALRGKARAAAVHAMNASARATRATPTSGSASHRPSLPAAAKAAGSTRTVRMVTDSRASGGPISAVVGRISTSKGVKKRISGTPSF